MVGPVSCRPVHGCWGWASETWPAVEIVNDLGDLDRCSEF